jgi:RNA polymerase sporulation-specific sigma factor
MQAGPVKRKKIKGTRARNEQVQENMGLVYAIARRFAGYGHDLEDLVQVGSIGLIKAVDRFDPSFGTRLSTYAVPLIIGEIRRYLRGQTTVHVSRSAQEMWGRAWKLRSTMTARLGREPTNDELARELGVDVSELVYLWESCSPPVSFEAGLFGRQEECWDRSRPAQSPEDVLTHERDPESVWVQRSMLYDALNTLDARERFVLVERFLNEKTQADVANKLGISQGHLSRIEKTAISKIRAKMEEA